MNTTKQMRTLYTDQTRVWVTRGLGAALTPVTPTPPQERSCCPSTTWSASSSGAWRSFTGSLDSADSMRWMGVEARAVVVQVLGVGESRSPVFSPGSTEPRREAGPAAMGHPPWGSSMGFTLSLI